MADLGPNYALVIGQFLTFLGLVVGLGAQYWRERRHRKDDLEDRTEQRTKEAQVAADLAASVTAKHAEIRSAVGEATIAAREAYTEANHANIKNLEVKQAISHLNERILAIVGPAKRDDIEPT